MATEAEKAEDAPISEAGDCNRSSGMVGNSTRTEESDVAQISKEGIVNHNNEGKTGNSGSVNFLESHSLTSKALEEISKDDTDSKDKPKPATTETHDNQTNETLEATCDIIKHDNIDASCKQVSNEMSLDSARENEVGLVNSTSISTTESDDENGKIHPAVPVTFLSDDLDLPEGLNEDGCNAFTDEMKQNNAASFDSKQGPVIEYVHNGDKTHHDHVTQSEDQKEEETGPYHSTEKDKAVTSMEKDNAEGHKSVEDPDFKCKEEDNMVSDVELEAHNKAELMACHLNTPKIYITEEPKVSKFEEGELECKENSSNFVGMVKAPETVNQTEGEHYRKEEDKTETEETSIQKSEAEEIYSPNITSNSLLDQTTVKADNSQKQGNDVNATEPKIQEKDISDKIEGVDNKYEKFSEPLEKEKLKVEQDDIKKVPPEIKKEDLEFRINETDNNTDKTPIVQIVEAHEVNDIKEVDCTTKDNITITTGESSSEETEVTEGLKNMDADKDTEEIIIEEDCVPDHSQAVIDEEEINHDHEEDKVQVIARKNMVGSDMSSQGSVIVEDVHPENTTTNISQTPIQGGHDEDKVTEGLEISTAEKDIQECIVTGDAVLDHSTTSNADQPRIYGHDTKVREGSEKPDAESFILKDVRHHSAPIDIVDEALMKDDQQEENVMEEEIVTGKKDIGETIIEENAQEYPTPTIEKEPILHDEEKVIQQLETDVADETTGECFIEGVVTDHSIEPTSIKEKPTKDGDEKNKIVDELETAGTNEVIKPQVRENDAVLDLTTTINEKSVNEGDEEEKITALSAITDATKGITDPVIEEDVIQDQSAATVGELPTKKGQQKEKVIEESEIATAEKDIEKAATEENLALDHSTTIILEKSIREVHEDDMTIEDATTEDVVTVTDYPKKSIGAETLKDGLEGNKVTEGLNTGSAEKDIDDPLICEYDKCVLTSTPRVTSSKDDHEKDKVTKGLEIVGTDKEIGDPSFKEIVFPDYSSAITVEETIRKDQTEEKVIDKVTTVEADSDNSEHVREEEVANSSTTIMEESTKDAHEEDEANEGLQIVHADKDFEVPIIDGNFVPYYSTTTIGEQRMNDHHEKDKEIETIEIDGADQPTPPPADEPNRDNHGQNKVTETLDSSSAHMDIDEHIIKEDVLDHSTTTISEENVTEGMETIDANKNSGEASTDENVVLDNCTKIAEQEPTKNGEENQVIEQIDAVVIDKEIGGPIEEEIVDLNHSTTATGEEASYNNLEGDEKMDGLPVESIDKNNEVVITNEGFAQEHSITTIQEEPTGDDQKENKDTMTIQVADEGESTEKKEEDEMVMDLHEKSTGAEMNEKISQEHEVSTELAIGEANNDAVEQIGTSGSITELYTVSNKREGTAHNSQEEQMEAKKDKGEVKELDLSMETTYQTLASTHKAETMTPIDEKEQHKDPHADSVTDSTMGETVEKSSEDLNDTSTGLKFGELEMFDGSSSLVSKVSEEKVNSEILEEKEGTKDGPKSLEARTEKASSHDAESEYKELTKSSEGVDTATSINDSETNTYEKEEGSLNKLKETIKEEAIDTKLMNHLGHQEIQNQEVVALFGLTSEEQNFKPVNLSENFECSDLENLTTHQLHDNHAKEVSESIPQNIFKENDIDGPRKEEQNVESSEKSRVPEIPQPWQDRIVDGERTMIEQNELEGVKIERTEEPDAVEALEHKGVTEGSHEATTVKEEHLSKNFDTETVKDEKIAEDDAVNDQSTVPCRYETVNPSFVDDEKEQKNIELEPELEDDYSNHTRAIERGSSSNNQHEEVHEEHEHTEKELMQDINVKDHTTNTGQEVTVQENPPKYHDVSNTPEAKVKQYNKVSTEEVADSARETYILHLKEVEKEETKNSVDAFGTTEETLEDITKMETHAKPNYSTTEPSVSEEQVMVEIPVKTESSNDESIFATPLTLHEAETEDGELVDVSSLASAKIIDDNTTGHKFTTDKSEAVAQEISDVPVEASSILLQSVDKGPETTPVEETTASKPSSDDIIERIPQEPSVVLQAKEGINMQMMEDPLLEQTKREMSMQSKQDIKLEEDPKMVTGNYGQKALKPELDLETQISEQKDGDMILEGGDIVELNEFKESSKSEASERSLKENQPENDESFMDLDSTDTCVDIKADILEKKEDPIKEPGKNLEERKSEILKVEENILEIQTNGQSEEINEPCNSSEKFTLAKNNHETTDSCEEFQKSTEAVDHNQSHEILPQTEETEVVNNGDIIEDQGVVFADDCTVGQSIKEEEKENEALDTHDVSHLMKETIVNEEVPCGVEGPKGDNTENQSREEKTVSGVEVLEDKTRDKEVKDADFKSSEGIANEKPDALTCVKELNHTVDARCDTEASTEEILGREMVVNAQPEDLGAACMGNELDIPTYTCLKEGDAERNFDNTLDLISEVQTTKNANTDAERITVGTDVKGIIESDIATKNAKEGFEEDQTAESAIPKEMTSAEVGDLCKVDSNFLFNEHKEGKAEEHDTIDGSVEEIFHEKEDNIKEGKCESTIPKEITSVKVGELGKVDSNIVPDEHKEGNAEEHDTRDGREEEIFEENEKEDNIKEDKRESAIPKEVTSTEVGELCKVDSNSVSNEDKECNAEEHDTRDGSAEENLQAKEKEHNEEDKCESAIPKEMTSAEIGELCKVDLIPVLDEHKEGNGEEHDTLDEKTEETFQAKENEDNIKEDKCESAITKETTSAEVGELCKVDSSFVPDDHKENNAEEHDTIDGSAEVTFPQKRKEDNIMEDKCESAIPKEMTSGEVGELCKVDSNSMSNEHKECNAEEHDTRDRSPEEDFQEKEREHDVKEDKCELAIPKEMTSAEVELCKVDLIPVSDEHKEGNAEEHDTLDENAEEIFQAKENEDNIKEDKCESAIPKEITSAEVGELCKLDSNFVPNDHKEGNAEEHDTVDGIAEVTLQEKQKENNIMDDKCESAIPKEMTSAEVGELCKVDSNSVSNEHKECNAEEHDTRDGSPQEDFQETEKEHNIKEDKSELAIPKEMSSAEVELCKVDLIPVSDENKEGNAEEHDTLDGNAEEIFQAKENEDNIKEDKCESTIPKEITSAEVGELRKVVSNFVPNDHKEGNAEEHDAIDGNAEVTFQEKQKEDNIMEDKCESAIPKEMTSAEVDELCKVESNFVPDEHKEGNAEEQYTIYGSAEEIFKEREKEDSVEEDECESAIPKEMTSAKMGELCKVESNFVPEEQQNIDGSTEDIFQEKQKENNVEEDKCESAILKEMTSAEVGDLCKVKSNFVPDEHKEGNAEEQDIMDGSAEETFQEKEKEDNIKENKCESTIPKEMTSAEVGELCKVDSNCVPGEHKEGNVEEQDTIDESAEEFFQEKEKENNIKQDKCESAIPREMTSAEVGDFCKVEPNFVPDEHNEGNAEEQDITDESAEETFQEKEKEDNIKQDKCDSGVDKKGKSNDADENTTTNDELIGKPLEKDSGLVLHEKIHETVTKPYGNEGTIHNDETDPEQLVEVKEPPVSIFGRMSTAEKVQGEEEHPIDNHDDSSLVEASQIEMQGKGASSNQGEIQGMVPNKVEEKENSLPTVRCEEDTEHKVNAPVQQMPKETMKEINDLNIQQESSAAEEREAQVVKQSDTPHNFKVLDQTSDVLTEKHILEASPTEKSGTGTEDPSPSVGVTQKSLQAAETKEGKLGAQENESEVKKIGEEEERIHSSGEEINIISKSSDAGHSLFDFLHKSRENTGQAAEQPAEEKNSPYNTKESETKDAPTAEAKAVDRTDDHEEVEEEGEDEDEHKKEDSGSDAPVMVEASRDIDIKPTPKKSHNILSGVGSKVKHSISKVKKAIIGKSSHQKQMSPK